MDTEYFIGIDPGKRTGLALIEAELQDGLVQSAMYVAGSLADNYRGIRKFVEVSWEISGTTPLHCAIETITGRGIGAQSVIDAAMLSGIAITMWRYEMGSDPLLLTRLQQYYLLFGKGSGCDRAIRAEMQELVQEIGKSCTYDVWQALGMAYCAAMVRARVLQYEAGGSIITGAEMLKKMIEEIKGRKKK